GDVQPNPKGDDRVAGSAARWYIYRITHFGTPKEIALIHSEFDKITDAMKPTETKAKPNRPFINKYFGPVLAQSMKEVMEVNDVKKAPATVINAAMMFPGMARIKDEGDKGAGAYLRGLVKDSGTSDVVRLFALKALKDAMPIVVQEGQFKLDPTDAAQNSARKRDKLNVTTLTDYIERNVNVAGMSVEEAEAIRYLRREAIIALAHAGAPAVLAKRIDNKEHFDGPVAPTLIKVLIPGAISPPPSMQEKIEAAIGLCHMKHPNMEDYDPSAAVFVVGRTIAEFVDDYNKDWGNIAAVGAARKLPMLAYRTEAKRLKEALIELEKNAKGTKANDLNASAKRLLDAMLAAKADTPFPRVDPPQELRVQVGNFKNAASGKIFKTLKVPAIPLN
ncbi:MAG: hypothetical protein HY289_01495, partial [Planctomycetes bacterium]|nr:hypothetical protein [Planctomycetota bacterium]